MEARGILMFFWLGLLTSTVVAQNATWIQSQRIDVKALDVRIDQLNSVYAIQKGEIVKFDATGKELTRYSNKLIGEKVDVDVSNPMKVLVFSAEQMRLFFLDSRLAELQEEISLYNEGYEQISLAATSHSNGFWLYDPINFKLIRYDQFFKKERESLNIAQLLRVEFYPADLCEIGNRVYLTDPQHGIFVFDVYGNYVKRIPLLGIYRLRISDGRLFYHKGEITYALHLEDADEQIVPLPVFKYGAFDVNRNHWCVIDGAAIFIFKPIR